MNAKEALKRISARCLDHPQRYVGGVHEMSGDIDAVNTALLQGEADAKELEEIKKRANQSKLGLVIDVRSQYVDYTAEDVREIIEGIIKGEGNRHV